MDDPIIARSALKHGLGEAEILAHADELAARFEDYEPVMIDEVDVAALAARPTNAQVADRLRHQDRTEGPDAERIVNVLRTSRR
ncbi:hypothetical protein [Actinomyces sp. ZJ308]|uniref:hypothetical protein n=1 Tax=Actinomyces sp. ZJ308 TaxID=2708342 RepID=UPI00141FF0EF|nr:hypothetical protein [Actinomyces sp. ZJ308]